MATHAAVEMLHDMDVVYLGFSATSMDDSNSGKVKILYNMLSEDVKSRARLRRSDVLVWTTTRSPSVYKGFNDLFQNVQPRKDGTFEQGEIKIVESIKNLMDADFSTHPFVLKNLSHFAFHSEREEDRIEKIILKYKVNIFQNLGINPKRRDRLLMIGYILNDLAI